MPRDGSNAALLENDGEVAVLYYRCRSSDLAKIRIIKQAKARDQQ